MDQLAEFSRQHNGDLIIVTFVANDDSSTPPTLRGILRSGLISPEPGSAYTGVQVFPRAGTRYAQVMTSKDGESLSGQFCPNGHPSAEDERSSLHQLIAMATLAREKIESAVIENTTSLAQASNERNQLLEQAQQASSERNQLLQHALESDNERQSAAQEITRLREEVSRAQRQRDELNERLSNFERSSPSPQHAVAQPSFTTPDMSSMIKQLTEALRAASQGPTGHASDTLATYLNPIAVSHGPGVSALISTATALALQNANFAVYKWPASDVALAHRMRIAVAEIASLIGCPERFVRWADHSGFTFTPTEWALYTTGSQQAALELAASAKIGDRSIHSILIFSRLPGSEISSLHDYASGRERVADASLLGSHNASTNKFQQLRIPDRTNDNSGRRGGRGGRGRGHSNNQQNQQPQRQVHGGATPDLSALNALVRS